MKKQVAGLAAALCLVAGGAQAQERISFVVPFSPGGPTDQVTRLIANELMKSTGKTYIVENKPGAAGIIAAQYVAQGPADGSVYMVGSPASLVINKGLYKKLPYDPETDFVPVSGLTRSPLVLVANENVKANTASAFVQDVKGGNEPAKMGSPGSGTIPHLAGSYFSNQVGIELLHVPYKGIAPAIAGLMAGDIDIVFDTLSTSMANIQAGKIKALGVASSKRYDVIGDVPTLAEQGHPVEASSWFGLVAPAATPDNIVQAMNADINKIIDAPDFKQRLLEMGSEPLTGSPAEFARFIQQERERWLPEVSRLELSAD